MGTNFTFVLTSTQEHFKNAIFMQKMKKLHVSLKIQSFIGILLQFGQEYEAVSWGTTVEKMFPISPKTLTLYFQFLLYRKMANVSLKLYDKTDNWLFKSSVHSDLTLKY